ncbi:hypothetical protein F3Y22_tig00110402pilonHSYRG00099 [Hibiscus syriacus]|uniref:Uncharacterized protein n=1 Tax=Hibiscus syriacus TaxID=106335 RepID=A0A6A3ANV7_HIBSY|nr:protein NUCLEAR FUSION DEFECTIVE 4-like [Hibiscus syriacus]KAE8706294.1 hypothetical protein F3Y22_tig00110402pilonHSYRG00099 [Hibiscus syriacus]
MGGLKEKFQAFMNNRWLVFVVAMWIQSFTGPGFLFGSISPVIKAALNYNQRQLSRLGVAKDLGACVGFLAGSLSEILPFWGVLFVGALHNLVGYGGLWLIVSGRAPVLPLWAMCALLFVGANGQTYFNTAVLVSCVQNFPKSRGPVVGILKGFSALSGAVLTQIYTTINFRDQSSLILMLALGPSMVVVAFMFIIRSVEGHKQVYPSDGLSFAVIYSVCLLLAAYLMGIMILEDVGTLNHSLVTAFTVILFVLIFIPIMLSFRKEPSDPDQEVLLPKTEQREDGNSDRNAREHEVVCSEVADEMPEEVGAKRTRGPRAGEDFTLMQALITADFWLIMLSLLLGSGSGLTVIDNLGQMSQSLGYDNAHIYVSVISIWNFLGRVGGGSFSEIIVRDHAYPRPAAIAAAQLVMAVGHVFFAMGWPGAMYIGTMLIGLCYGAHWAIVPATASELFGLKKFGALYNFLNLANPAGTLIFSSLIASSIYDREAEKQAHQHHMQPRIPGSILSGMFGVDEPPKCEGSICFFLSSMIMSGFCIIAAGLSMILVYRTKTVFARLYGKSHT